MKQEAIIEPKNVHKDYVMGDSRIRAFEDVSLQIKRGDFVALTGHSGSENS